MDDSEPDFSFLCSRLLKRVRRRAGESGDEKKAAVKDEDKDSGSQLECRSKAPCKRKRQRTGGVRSKRTHRACTAGRGAEGEENAVVKREEHNEPKIPVKEKVLSRMQQFKRATPPRLVHAEEAKIGQCAVQPVESQPLPAEGLTDNQVSDRPPAQQQLGNEAELQAVVDVEDSGLIFCQLCSKDLSAFNHQLRTRHINRCLDEQERSTSRVPGPRMPECPFCGRGFKSEKTRSAHLKRCSASVGMSPAELLKALQSQAAERESGQRTGSSSGTSDCSKPARKRTRKKAARMDEDTMLALALSRSLLEQETERDGREDRHAQARRLSSTVAARLPGTNARLKSRVKRRKGDPAAPLPLLLLQDPRAAQNRIQERVSSLLLLPRPATPPTPTMPPSTLCTNTLLWAKSALAAAGPPALGEFYTADLGEFIQPEEKASSCLEMPVKQLPVASAAEQPDAPQCPCTPTHSSPGTQALLDVLVLAEEGMTHTPYKQTDADPPLSGFVPEPEVIKPSRPSMSVLRLSSDLGSMLNNPQLSDVQLQVDCGDVYFAHSFMLYARCPLLASMVHDAGFGVQEEGFPGAQRVLLNDVSGEAVFTLLQYLYTAVCHPKHSLLPDVYQLASRFGLSELQQQCEQYSKNVAEDHKEQDPGSSPDHEHTAEPQQTLIDRQFLDLLRSMWEHGDGEEVRGGAGGTQGEDETGEGDGEVKEDVVDEEELKEIYEFAATQRKTGTKEMTADCGTEEEDEEVDNTHSGVELAYEAKPHVEIEDVGVSRSSDNNQNHSRASDSSLERSYNQLFSESWAEYTEPTHTNHSDRNNTLISRRASASEVIDLSISPPPERGDADRMLFPAAGASPGETGDQRGAVKQTMNANAVSPLTAESRSTPSASPPDKPISDVTNLPPASSSAQPKPSRGQPELIVLSDSSCDMEHDLHDQLPSCCDSPRRASPSQLDLCNTRVNHTTQAKRSPKACRTPGSDQLSGDLLDASAEVSWLIPATPVPSTGAGSTQPCSSMRRTRLFPTTHSSSSSSASDHPKTTSHTLRQTRRELSQLSLAFQKLPSHSRLSETSHSERVAPTHSTVVSAFCSSTPLHAEPLQHLHTPGSPLLSDDELQIQERASEERKLECLHLSSSGNSRSPRDLERSTEETEAVETRSGDTNAGEVMEDGLSFVFDEPPIAFDDSWGLGGAVAQEGPQLSLRLESSGAQPSSPEQSGPCAAPHTFASSGHLAQGNPPEPEAPFNHSIPDAAVWDSWNEEEEEAADAVPLFQRVGAIALTKRVTELRTPVACKKNNQAPLVPITPMPSFSDMDTPDLKNRLNRYGVRPLPKKQMVLKLKEIHQYTHQLMSSSSEEETSPRNRAQATTAAFKQPTAPPPVSARALQFGREEEQEDALPGSQDSNTSSTAESERSNPEMCDSDDDGSDGEDITASQAAVREKDKLQAVRSYILSNPLLYGRVLQYQPLALSELKLGLRAAGVRLGTAKLLDFLDSQCVTFTTAKQGQPAPSRRRARTAGRGRKRIAKSAE